MNEVVMCISMLSLAISAFVAGDYIGPGRRRREQEGQQKEQRLLEQGRRQGHDDIALKLLSGAITRKRTELLR